jgi:uncharacterized glyoxalase superfamily protein PhnB
MSADSSAQTVKRAEPQSLRARSLSVSLTVNDVARSLAWYEGVAGFTVEEKYEHEGRLAGVSLKAGDVGIMITQDDGAKGWDRVKGQGMSLYLTTVQNVDEIAKQIKARGGVLESEPADMEWGARLFWLKDPDGFRLAIAADISREGQQ